MYLFGERIKQLRIERDLSQKQVANAIGIAERNYRRYEISDSFPSCASMILFAKYFDVSLDYLVGLSDDKHPTNEPYVPNSLSEVSTRNPYKSSLICSLNEVADTLTNEQVDLLVKFAKQMSNPTRPKSHQGQ